MVKLVAFIEDHCFPARDWAEKLIEARVGPWATDFCRNTLRRRSPFRSIAVNRGRGDVVVVCPQE